MSKRKTQQSIADANSRVDNWAYLWFAIFMVIGYAFFKMVLVLFKLTVLKWTAVAAAAFILGAFAYAFYEGRVNEKLTVYVISFLSIVVRLYYILLTQSSDYAGSCAPAISEMAENLTLPKVGQPLYYVIAAGMKYLAGMTGFFEDTPFELVRLANEYFGVISIVVMYYILCELEANITGIYLCTALIAFHPSLIILGGGIDQTSLFVMLTMFTVLFLSRWNNFSESINFIFAGISLGLAMMTDLRALLMLPVIIVLAVINLSRILKRRQFISITASLIQTIIGAVLSGALALAYPIYCKINGNGAVNIFSSQSVEKGGSASLSSKFLTIPIGRYISSGGAITQNDSAWEYLIKSSLFNDKPADMIHYYVMMVYLILGAMILILPIMLGVMALFSHMDGKKKENIAMLIGFMLLMLGGYVYINSIYTSSISMSFVNIAQILPVLTALLAGGLKVLGNKKKYNIGANIAYMLTVLLGYVFCIGSIGYYLIFIN